MKKWVKLPLLLLCLLLLIASCYYCVNYGTVRVSSNTANYYSDAEKLIQKVESSIQNSTSKKYDLSTTSTISIQNEGIYELSGTCLNASIEIDTDADIILILNNVNLSNNIGSVINVENANSVLIYSLENTENTISSGEEVEITSTQEDLSGAAIFSKDNLYLGGKGILNVNGYINNAIASNDSLLILSGTYNITALNNGIKAHDYLEIYYGTINVVSGNDGIKAINDEDQNLGIINIYNGVINIVPMGDGISAVSNLLIENGTINITSPNYTESTSVEDNKDPGSNQMMEPNDNRITEEMPSDNKENVPSFEKEISNDQYNFPSNNEDKQAPDKPSEEENSEQRSIEPKSEMPLDNNEFNGGNKPSDNFNQENKQSSSSSNGESNKGLKVDNTLTINNGTITINTVDDAIHSNNIVNINDGILALSTNDDGIHGDGVVTINGGNIKITNSYEGIEGHQIYVNDGTIDLYSTDDGFNASGESDCILQINGGNIIVNAAGDGLDSNGDLIINGGYTIVNGPTNAGNGPLDSGSENGGEILVNGGEILAVGASGMDEGFDSSSSQASIHLQTNTVYDAGSVITIYDDQGNILFTYITIKSSLSSVVYSSPSLIDGTTYTITINDDSYSLTMENNVASNATGMGGMSMGGNSRQGGNMGGKRNH